MTPRPAPLPMTVAIDSARDALAQFAYDRSRPAFDATESAGKLLFAGLTLRDAARVFAGDLTEARAVLVELRAAHAACQAALTLTF